MKTISIRELHLQTGRWIRHAASRGPIVVTDRGRRITVLQAFDATSTGQPLPDREATIRKRSRVPVDSVVYQAEVRGRSMIYFDAAYIAKCYLNEPGADRVRKVARSADGLASCELGRLEFAAILTRHVREEHITRREMASVLKEFEEDEANGVWQWLSVTSALLDQARTAVLALPRTVFVRTGDALHLACAAEHGFAEVYTNDRHMLQAARYFHVTGVDVLGG